MAFTISKREASFRELEKLVGVSETTGPNHGPVVDKIEAADSLPGDGYSYCQSTQNYAWKLANGELLAFGTPSVWAFVQWAVARDYEVKTSYAYDFVTYNFGESGGAFDHVGQVEKVLLRFGSTLVLQTIEGNTSPTASGSQSNGGGVYRKTRTVDVSKVRFFRVPGLCPHPARYAPKPTLAQQRAKLRAAILAKRSSGATWAALRATAAWKRWKALGGK